VRDATLKFFLLLTLLLGSKFATVPAGAEAMPEDFVYLRDIDPTIRQDMRYAGPANFIGQPVPGYDAAECVLVRQAAEALKKVQAALGAKGLSLKVYDCYRPARAVAAFVDWAKAPDDPEAKAAYYPNLSKGTLIPDYIAPRSGHSRGATVDLTLVPIEDGAPASIDNGKPQACTAPQKDQAPDGSLAMGTTFDCFDTKSNLGTPGLTAREHENREILRAAMLVHGFKDYSPEWWHFTLKDEPYPVTFFDFPIRPHPAGGNR
jgi:D-alanyl-D-alanine dipeptidase